jgi:hypothetical protein
MSRGYYSGLAAGNGGHPEVSYRDLGIEGASIGHRVIFTAMVTVFDGMPPRAMTTGTAGPGGGWISNAISWKKSF